MGSFKKSQVIWVFSPVCVLIFFFLGDKKTAIPADKAILIKVFSIKNTLSKNTTNKSVRIKITKNGFFAK